jgi:hypothetical protein
MPDTTSLDQASTMIEAAWARPIHELEALAIQRPAADPLLRAAMHIRSSLIVSANAVLVHQERLHAITRPSHVPAFYDLERITKTADDLRIAEAESRTALQAISHIIDARAAALPPDPAPAIRLAQAAIARTTRTPRAPAQPSQAPSAPAASSPEPAPSRPHR